MVSIASVRRRAVEVEGGAMATDVRETMARESLRIRALRTRYFPHDIFAEYAWVLLLDAYLHHVGGAPDTERELVRPLDGQVMGHWRRYLEQQALIVPGGAAASPPALTAIGLAQMERYLDDLARAAADIG